MAIHPAKKRHRDRLESWKREAAGAAQDAAANVLTEAINANTSGTNDGPRTAQGDVPAKHKKIRRDEDNDKIRETEEADDRRYRVIAANEKNQRDRTEDSETPVPFRDDWSDPDTASIASRDSEDLAVRRPNRWRGNPRAWQHITELDRAVVAAMGRTRDRDLAVHLYNAFHMKRTVDPKDPDAWGPKAYWTAWPLRLRDILGLSVFDDGGGNDLWSAMAVGSGRPDDIPIFRSHYPRAESRPSMPLEEMLTATIQRVAREQFHARRRTRQQARLSQPSAENGTAGPTSKPTSTPTTTPTTTSDTVDTPAVVLADDELAAHLLQPSVRHLLAQVDKVLSILHNVRVATAAIEEDSESALTAARSRRQRSPSVDVGGGATGTGLRKIARPLPQPSKKRVCTRPRNWASGPELMMATAPTAEVQVHTALATDHQGERAQMPARQTAQHKPVSTTKGQPREVDGRGRPAKRRERFPGETEKQFLIRIARQAHRRIPDFSDDDEEDVEKEGGKEQQPKEKAILPNTPAVASRNKAPPVRQRTVSFADNVNSVDIKPKGMKGFIVDGDSDSSDDESDWQTGDKETGHRKRTNITARKGRPSDKTMARWPLRDWTDVLGAAALSGGFDPEVLARTAQRCADLFGQSMAMDTLIGVGEKPRDVMQYYMHCKKSLSIDSAVYAPGPAGPYPGLATITAEEDTTALDTITLEVQRAQARRQDRLAQRQAFMEKRLKRLEQPVSTADRGDDDDEGSQDDGASEKSTDGNDSDDNDGDTNTAKPTSAVSRSKSRSTSIIPPPVILASTSTSTAPEVKPKPRFGPQPKPTPTVWYCPRSNCPRAVDGFTRRPNMVRHLKLMHNVVIGTGHQITAPQPQP